MVIVGILSWWYSTGLALRLKQAQQQLAGVYDYFSIDLLLKTLFSPFRQISAGGVRGPIAVQIRAFVDRLFSRVIGFVVRSIVVVIGSAALLLSVLVSFLMVIAWLAMPVLPIIGIILGFSGWAPWTI